MAADPWIVLLLKVSVFIGTGGVFALLLHLSGLPGGRPASAVVGGIVAGLLLGPSVFGGLAPAQSERFFEGAAVERNSLRQLELQHKADRAAQTQADPSPESFEELAGRHEREREPLVSSLEAAESRVQTWMGAAMVGLISLGLGLAAWAKPGHVDSAPRLPVSETVIAGAVVLFAAVPTALLFMWALKLETSRAVAAGAVIAAGSLFGSLPIRWMNLPGRAPIMRRIGLVGSIMAAGMLAWAIPIERIGFLLVPVGCVGFGSVLARGAAMSRRGRRFARGVCLWVCMPAGAAYLAREVDGEALIGSWRLVLLVVVAVLTAGAGHFIGSYLAIQTAAPEAVRARAGATSVELLASGIGLTQVCFGVVLLAAIPGSASPIVVAMILANAATIEIQAPLNRKAVAALM